MLSKALLLPQDPGRGKGDLEVTPGTRELAVDHIADARCWTVLALVRLLRWYLTKSAQAASGSVCTVVSVVALKGSLP